MSAYSWTIPYNLRDSVANAKEIMVGEAEFGRIYVPNGLSGTSLTFYASPYSENDEDNSDNANYEPVHDSSGAITLTIAADESHQIPADVLAGARFLKIVSNQDDEDVFLSFCG